MIKKIASFVLLAFILQILFISPTAYSNGPLQASGNVVEVMETAATITGEQDLILAIEEAQRNTIDCPEGEVPKPAALTRSPLNQGPRRRAKFEFFFDAEYIAGGQNGDMDISANPQPYISIPFTINKHATNNSISISDVLSKSDAELLSIFKASIDPSLGLSASQLDDMANAALIITRMGNYSNANEAMEYAAGQLSNATKSQKLSFLSGYMGSLAENYEDEMLAGGSAVGAVRTDDDLHSALSGSIQTGNVIPAGVCRQIHMMGVRFARELGFNESFGVGFATAGSAHRTLVITDPNNPNQVIQANYDNLAVNNGVSGVAALSQNGSIPDAGIRFRIYNAKDKVAIILPSDLGGLLNRVSGGQDSDLGQRFQDRSQILQAGLNTNIGTFRFFKASSPLGTGAETMGVSYNTRVELGESFYLEPGVAFFSTSRDTAYGELSSSGIYARTTAGFDRELLRRENFSLRAFAETHVRVAAFKANIDYDESLGITENESQLNGDFNIDSQFGLSADYRIGDVWSRTSFTSQGFVSFANATHYKGVALYAPTQTLDHDSYIPIGNEATLNTGVGFTIYNLGTSTYATYDANIGVESPKIGLSFNAGIQGRATANTPIWIGTDAENAAFVEVKKGIINNRFYVGATAQQSFDLFGNHFLGLNIGGNIGR